MTNRSCTLNGICENDTAGIIVLFRIKMKLFDQIEKSLVLIMFSKFHKLMIQISQIHMSFILNHFGKIGIGFSEQLFDGSVDIPSDSCTSHYDLSFTQTSLI